MGGGDMLLQMIVRIVFLLGAATSFEYGFEPLADPAYCSKLVDCTRDADCLLCEPLDACQMNSIHQTYCRTHPSCAHAASVRVEAHCNYCYQLPASEYECDPVTNCTTTSTQLETTTCTVRPGTLCLGRRRFPKRIRCNWTSGISWATTMFLSLTMGGFGVDRFYLGLWKSGVGKLFSFGGLGIWTVVDAVLIATGYIGPADGSRYV